MSLEKQVNVQRIVSAFVGHSVDYLRMIHRVQPDNMFLGHSILSIYLFSYLIMYPKCVAAVYKTTGQLNQSPDYDFRFKTFWLWSVVDPGSAPPLIWLKRNLW